MLKPSVNLCEKPNSVIFSFYKLLDCLINFFFLELLLLRNCSLACDFLWYCPQVWLQDYASFIKESKKCVLWDAMFVWRWTCGKNTGEDRESFTTYFITYFPHSFKKKIKT